MNPSAHEQDAAQLLTVFSFEESYFAVDALRIQEIIRVGTITPVHMAPEHILGIINLRGHIVTVMDPARRLHLGDWKTGADSRILIVDWQDEQIGLLVPRVHDMTRAEEGLGVAPPNLRSALGTFLAGITRYRDHMVSVLDLKALLSVEEPAS
jgi:purine-binding chemotaxis protein CheW